MKSQQKSAARRDDARRARDSGSSWTWRIGAGRVTTEEIESWQLGPDLTQQHARSTHSKARQFS